MFIYHEKQPYWFDGRYIYGVEIDAYGYKIDETKANDVPKGYDCTYGHRGICAVLGIIKNDILNKRTGKVEGSSNKTVKSVIENPKYKFNNKVEQPKTDNNSSSNEVNSDLEV